MSKFISVTVRERVEGQPGFMKPKEFTVKINPAQITLFNKSEESKDVTFVRLSCGITLCVVSSESKFSSLVEKCKV